MGPLVVLRQPQPIFSMLYVVVPIVMIYLSVALPRRVNRTVDLVVAGLYLVSIVGLAIGEWNYYILGSVVEAVFFVLVIRHAWTWREPVANVSSPGAVRTTSSGVSA